MSTGAAIPQPSSPAPAKPDPAQFPPTAPTQIGANGHADAEGSIPRSREFQFQTRSNPNRAGGPRSGFFLACDRIPFRAFEDLRAMIRDVRRRLEPNQRRHSRNLASRAGNPQEPFREGSIRPKAGLTIPATVPWRGALCAASRRDLNPKQCRQLPTQANYFKLSTSCMS
jgi:hypothetical protein